jgi:hypothetical protein
MRYPTHLDLLEPGDHYYNKRKWVTFPNDSLLDKPDELAAMSGPIKTYFVGKGESPNDQDARGRLEMGEVSATAR